MGFEWVCEEIVHILKPYGMNSVVGDQYGAAIIQQHLGKLGISYKDFTFGARTRAELFGNLKHLLVQRKIELLDDPGLLRELRGLEERSSPSGNVDIRPAYGQKDDLAVAVALAALELSNRSNSFENLMEFMRRSMPPPHLCPKSSVLGGLLSRVGDRPEKNFSASQP